MHANASNTHLVVSHIAGTTWGAVGSLQTSAFTNADEANALFEHRCQLKQGVTDNDADGEENDTRYVWVMWYAKGRLIKYRKLDQ